jgi:hypothetical protein
VTRTIREVTNEHNVIAFDSKMNLNIRIQDHEKLRKMETELLCLTTSFSFKPGTRFVISNKNWSRARFV